MADFLECIYGGDGAAPDGAAASADGVVRLARALDAPDVLAAARAHLAGALPGTRSITGSPTSTRTGTLSR